MVIWFDAHSHYLFTQRAAQQYSLPEPWTATPHLDRNKRTFLASNIAHTIVHFVVISMYNYFFQSTEHATRIEPI